MKSRFMTITGTMYVYAQNLRRVVADLLAVGLTSVFNLTSGVLLSSVWIR